MYPDTLISPTSKFYTVTNFLVRPCLYRDTAPLRIYKTPVRGLNTNHLECLYLDTHSSQKVCTMTAKIAPCFASYGLIGIVGENLKFCRRPPVAQHQKRPLTAGPLGFIASKNRQPAFKTIYHDIKISSTYRDHPFTNLISTLPACTLAYLHMIIHGFVF